ncbi:Hypothetical predicted protein [Olea europaea subsp. europaea]|uniref:Uncharacterized protein n=1 Tax=Olea europaea subsp. europaea TaxID=158383 RepID=A0A8S0RY57_OLEEU|nr:Hypothetical predicted protein [Olea europaea subsp. europaea]
MAQDVNADIASSESLSFTGLVCIQDQDPQNQLRKSFLIPDAKMLKNEHEFEFRRNKSSTTIGSLINEFSADKSFSDGQANQSQVTKHIDLEAMLSPIQSHRRRSDVNQSEFRNSNRKQITEVNKETNEKRNSFSQRFFQSLVSPCRDCCAVQPAPSM